MSDLKNTRKVLHPCNWTRTSKRRKVYNWRLSRCPRDWSRLPRNVLFDIMDKLSAIEDYVRFGAVCHSWRTIFLEETPENINKHCAQPFLLIPTTETPTADPTAKATKGVLYSLSTRRVYRKFHLRLPADKYFQGSSFGWLVSLERKNKYNYQVQLHNPFLSKDYIIDLPPPDELQRQHVDVYGVGGWSGHYIRRAVLSSDPSLSDDFIVMVMSRFHGLAFCKYGDTCWTSIDTYWTSIGDWVKEWDTEMFHDLIFFSKTKQFYALRYNGEVVAIDFRGKESKGPQLLQVMPPVTLFAEAITAYLVEDLSGELLAVMKSDICAYKLTVYKLDLVEQKWIKICNLGNTVLFLGFSGSIARSLSDCPGCQPNCIYFTEDVMSSRPRKQSYGQPDSRVYSLDDDTIQPHYHQPTTPHKYYLHQFGSSLLYFLVCPVLDLKFIFFHLLNTLRLYTAI